MIPKIPSNFYAVKSANMFSAGDSPPEQGKKNDGENESGTSVPPGAQPTSIDVRSTWWDPQDKRQHYKVEETYADGSKLIVDHDGCSSPWAANVARSILLGGGLDPNNPAGGKQTAFSDFVKFDRACNRHDACYQTPGANKDTCDEQFLANMRDKDCTHPEDNFFDRFECKKQAYIYHGFVQKFGGNSFDTARAKGESNNSQKLASSKNPDK